MQNVIDKIEWMFAGLGGFWAGSSADLMASSMHWWCLWSATTSPECWQQPSSMNFLLKLALKGIAKKVCIFVLVGIANIIDTQILQNGAAIRTAVVFSIWQMKV